MYFQEKTRKDGKTGKKNVNSQFRNKEKRRENKRK